MPLPFTTILINTFDKLIKRMEKRNAVSVPTITNIFSYEWETITLYSLNDVNMSKSPHIYEFIHYTLHSEVLVVGCFFLLFI